MTAERRFTSAHVYHMYGAPAITDWCYAVRRNEP